MKLGAHMSIAGGLDRAIDRGASIGCRTIQLFLKNNARWSGRRPTAEELRRFAARRAETGIHAVFAHASYLINLAATDPEVHRRSVAASIDEVRRATQLGLPFVVLHPGAHMGAGEAAGLRRIAGSLDEVLARTADSPVRIALETTAGQGTNLGWRFEHLAAILELARPAERLSLCLDTCHLLAAGYDIRTAQGYATTMDELERTVGSWRVVALHLNDSRTPLGSRVDRHEHIGRGQVGLEAFRALLHDPRWAGLPLVLETPKNDDLHEDVENLRVLRELLGSAAARGRADGS
jgi:deoxyribonuclease-4